MPVIYTAICDDDRRSAEKIRGYLEEYGSRKPELQFAIDVFASSMDLMTAMEKRGYDLYLLDIYIDAVTGVQLAEQIRNKSDDCRIIFVSSSDNFYRDAFRMRIDDYLEKPIDAETLHRSLDRIFTDFDEKYLYVNDATGIRRIPMSSVLYVVSMDHYKKIVTTDGSYLVRRTMAEMTEELTEEYFYPLHSRVIVNVRRIVRSSPKEIEMEDGESFRLPRGSYHEIGERILKYSI
ncbi:MAG: LytTR family DNA-binding domain-containing protein [Eubacterium sp.]|nr:LytTR family DNA-binding domain-containing protein [Eubacterium sp.]